MASKNVEAVRATHASWARRDFEGVTRHLADKFFFIDHGSGRTLNSPDEFKEWTRGWVKVFSDGKHTNEKYLDAGDTVVAEFIAEGTNDGPFAGFPPTGRHLAFPVCQIWRFDKNGQIVSGAGYLNQYTILIQLGHAKPLGAAA